ncbi:MAG TPA: DUF4412 domain-containing protein [Balneolaceae bacterium]|nr:DUF4412 domain-containing protein [Balneolaceae bacterium]
MKKSGLLLILFFCFSVTQSFGQFEGKIKFNSYKIVSGHKKNDDVFTLYVTPERLLLQGNKKYKVEGTFQTDGILVRNKQKDFIFLTGGNKAMKITESGITAFVNMFGNQASNTANKVKSNISYKKTGNKKKINGYSCEEFIITNKQEPDQRSEVWMTKGLNINWGILADSWNNNMKQFAGNGFLSGNLLFQQGYFPIEFKEYKNKKLSEVIDAHVTSTKIARSKVKIPSGVQVVGLQQYLLQRMQQMQSQQ